MSIDPSKMKFGPIKVYFASQTGTAEQFANDFAEDAKEKSIWCVPTSFKDIKLEELQKEKFAVFIIATHYEGEAPDDSAPAWEEFSKITDPTCLSNLKYTGFALGDLTYKHYCGFGKLVNNKLEALGGKRIHDFGTGSNDQNKIETFFLQWKEGVWGDVMANLDSSATTEIAT